uniref:Uncharacterized protein n=1 Tax=Chromera velia CCMP2878 TaxID=1169474 RepID=A0A0G4FQD2_9ALVE|eukprot:Cvel_18033.t1-p1 / transcript=Cvel_18033.t1 / gene=Cvel_18033 / organism=Chromera_velia_CCMP2878 / gene_product=hypothetical protein / transcript_product=hypothetical protein / location=Cvel_scaffold1472:28697-29104(-) / protein_length=136 / sequence_SO=supercontig / SO=protein_coding / is_pseudo=false
MIPLFMAILLEEVNEELMKKGDISDFTELSKTAQHYYELNNPKYASTNPVNAYGVPSTAPQPNKATPIPPIAAVNAGAYPDLSRVLSQLQGQVAALQSQVDRSNSPGQRRRQRPREQQQGRPLAGKQAAEWRAEWG